MPQSHDATLLIRLPQAMLDAVGEYATANDVSVSSCIRVAIADFLGIAYQDKLTPEERAAIRAKKQRKYQAEYRRRQANG